MPPPPKTTMFFSVCVWVRLMWKSGGRGQSGGGGRKSGGGKWGGHREWTPCPRKGGALKFWSWKIGFHHALRPPDPILAHPMEEGLYCTSPHGHLLFFCWKFWKMLETSDLRFLFAGEKFFGAIIFSIFLIFPETFSACGVPKIHQNDEGGDPKSLHLRFPFDAVTSSVSFRRLPMTAC